jgi:thiosulfate dehydrogenase [quinone] large subunit
MAQVLPFASMLVSGIGPGSGRDHRDAAHALLRITVGVMFLFYGIGKFRGGLFAFTHGLVHSFDGQLPAVLVKPFATVLPFAEVIVGALLIVGLFTRGTLVAAGLLVIALTLGVTIKPDPETVAHNVQFGVAIFLLLWSADRNGWSVDRLRGRGR